MSYTGKVHRKQGGDELVVASGGKITVESGGSIENAGDTYVVSEPDDVTLEATGDPAVLKVKDAGIDTTQLSAGVVALLDLIDAIPTVDPEDSATIWNDNGVLKVASAGG